MKTHYCEVTVKDELVIQPHQKIAIETILEENKERILKFTKHLIAYYYDDNENHSYHLYNDTGDSFQMLYSNFDYKNSIILMKNRMGREMICVIPFEFLELDHILYVELCRMFCEFFKLKRLSSRVNR